MIQCPFLLFKTFRFMIQCPFLLFKTFRFMIQCPFYVILSAAKNLYKINPLKDFNSFKILRLFVPQDDTLLRMTRSSG